MEPLHGTPSRGPTTGDCLEGTLSSGSHQRTPPWDLSTGHRPWDPKQRNAPEDSSVDRPGNPSSEGLLGTPLQDLPHGIPSWGPHLVTPE